MASPATVSTAEQPSTLKLENVLYDKKDGVAYVTLNRPKVLNALNPPTWADLRTAFEDARDDAAVRGVILTGAGDKAFIAGADISELAHVSAVRRRTGSRFGQGVLDLVENFWQARDRGDQRFALGGGCETAMACTIRMAAESTRSSVSLKSSWECSPAVVALSGCRGWSARVGRCSSFSPAE